MSEHHADIESSQRQHYESIRHTEAMEYLATRASLTLFELLRPKLYRDGDHWCVLMGGDIQTGVVGFGRSPVEAINAWTRQFYVELPDGATDGPVPAKAEA